ncbi:MAG: hypothetical protein ACYC6B_03250 [Thermoleophilia bacterium]
MKQRTKISVLLAALTVLAGMLFLTGCGDSAQTTTAAQIACDNAAPSIIPAPSGRAMLVEFYRDT